MLGHATISRHDARGLKCAAAPSKIHAIRHLAEWVNGLLERGISLDDGVGESPSEKYHCMINSNLIDTNPSEVAGNGIALIPAEFPTDVAKSVSICDTQPVTAEGVRTLLSKSADLRFLGATASLRQAAELVRNSQPDVLILDKAFGIQAVLNWLMELHPVSDALSSTSAPPKTGFVVWGGSLTEGEALRFLQAGARGILRKTSDVHAVLSCLRAVAQGRSWMEDSLVRDPLRASGYARTELTGREQQVLELVEQGLKNKDVGRELGIQTGTVKIHLKHIFQKTGVRGRYGLALNGLKDRGMIAVSA